MTAVADKRRVEVQIEAARNARSKLEDSLAGVLDTRVSAAAAVDRMVQRRAERIREENREVFDLAG